MSKQLITILKKRYVVFLVLAIAAILSLYTFSGIKGVRSWEINSEYFRSKEHLDMLKDEESNFFNEDKYQGLSFDEKVKLYQGDNLNIIRYDYFYDETITGKQNKDLYNSFYYSEAFLPLLILVSAAGFLLFFADLKTSFNSFVFSLGVPKREVYWYKHLLISVPFLLSILLGKFILTGIILANIPEQFINISTVEMLSSIVGSWITLVFFFFTGSFIGLVTGSLILGPLTVLGFTLTINWFVAGYVNGWNYVVGNHSDASLFYQSNFFYELGQNKVNWSNVVITLVGILLIIFVSSLLYTKLSLEKNGNYLLFDSIRIPVLLLFIFYAVVIFTFSSGLYPYVSDASNPTPASPVLIMVISALISGCVGSYIIFRNQINSLFYKKFILKNKMLH